jgi:aspartate carbamoyltransferase catalytic subunit
MTNHICEELKRKKINYTIHKKIEEIVNKVDILYMTRIQGERFPDQMEYEKIKNIFVLTADMLSHARTNLKVLHPLPRVGEITADVDTTKYAYYFEQAENGLYVRQALLAMVLGKLN